MPVTVKSKSGDAVSAKELLAKHRKTYGEKVGNFGGTLFDDERIPTGLFPLDLAIGGGIPRRRCSIIYGPESSNKTNIALKLIANHQRMFPELTCVYVAIEPFDAPWARLIGVNTEALVVLYPNYAEEAVDMTVEYLYADDIGLVVLDSLAAMITTAEDEKDASSAIVGGSAIVVGKLVRKTTTALREAEKHNRGASLVYINQTRFKIGVMYGNPEDMPGGNAPKFQAAIWLRVGGKNVMDSKVSDQFPVLKEVNFNVKKNKCPILATTGMFKMAVHAHGGLAIGDTDDINTITSYLKAQGRLVHPEKASGNYTILGEEYKTILLFKERVYNDPDFGAGVRQKVIEYALKEKGGFIQDGVEINADGEVVGYDPKGAGDAAVPN